MLSSIFKNILTDVLGEYIEEFRDENIETDAMSGQFSAVDLTLKRTALDKLSTKLGFPVKMLMGTIGKVELSLDLSLNEQAKSTVLLEDVHILAEPSHTFDYHFQQRMSQEKINSQVSEAFLGLVAKFFEEKDHKDLLAWHTKKIAEFVSNINLEVRRIHIRVEEQFEAKKFNFGLTVEKIEKLNVDSKNEVKYLSKEKKTEVGKTFSLVRVNRACLYFNDTATVKGETFGIAGKHFGEKLKAKDFSSSDFHRRVEQFVEFSRQFIPTETNVGNYYYLKFVAKNVSFSVKTRENLNLSDLPDSTNLVECGEFKAELTEQMVEDLKFLLLLQRYHTEEATLGVKKDFGKAKFTVEQNKMLLRNGIMKYIGKNKQIRLEDCFRMKRDYLQLSYVLFLREDEFLNSRLPKEAKKVNLEEYSGDMINNDIKRRMSKIELVFGKKYALLLKMKSFLKYREVLAEEEKKSRASISNQIFSYFKAEKEIKEVKLDWSELFKTIEAIDSTETMEKKVKETSLLHLKLGNCSLSFMSAQNKVSVEGSGIFVQQGFYKGEHHKIVLVEKISISGPYNTSNKFSAILSPEQEADTFLNIDNSVEDELDFDEDLWPMKLKRDKFKTVSNCFFKASSYENSNNEKGILNSYRQMKLKKFSLFLDLPFLSLASKFLPENKTTEEPQNTAKIEQDSVFLEFEMDQTEVYLINNLLKEDYSCLLGRLEQCKLKFNPTGGNGYVKGASLGLVDNFLFLRESAKKEYYKVVDDMNVSLEKKYQNYSLKSDKLRLVIRKILLVWIEKLSLVNKQNKPQNKAKKTDSSISVSFKESEIFFELLKNDEVAVESTFSIMDSEINFICLKTSRFELIKGECLTLKTGENSISFSEEIEEISQICENVILFSMEKSAEITSFVIEVKDLLMRSIHIKLLDETVKNLKAYLPEGQQKSSSGGEFKGKVKINNLTYFGPNFATSLSCDLSLAKKEETEIRISHFNLEDSGEAMIIKLEGEPTVIVLREKRTEIAVDKVEFRTSSEISSLVEELNSFKGEQEAQSQPNSSAISLKVNRSTVYLGLDTDKGLCLTTSDILVNKGEEMEVQVRATALTCLRGNSSFDSLSVKRVSFRQSLTETTLNVDGYLKINFNHVLLLNLKEVLAIAVSIPLKRGNSAEQTVSRGLSVSLIDVEMKVFDFSRDALDSAPSKNYLCLTFPRLKGSKTVSSLSAEAVLSIKMTQEHIVKSSLGYELPSFSLSLENDSSLAVSLCNFNFVYSETAKQALVLGERYNYLFNKMKKYLNSSSKSSNPFIILRKIKNATVSMPNIQFSMKESVNTSYFQANQYVSFTTSVDAVVNYNEAIEKHDLCMDLRETAVFCFNSKSKNSKKTVSDREFILYPTDIGIRTKRENGSISLNLSPIEVTLSFKKIGTLSIFKKLMSSSKKRVSKNKVHSNNKFISKLLENDTNLSLELQNLNLVFAREGFEYSNVFEPLILLDLNHISLKKDTNSSQMSFNLKTDYFNTFNESWEPIIEETTISLENKGLSTQIGIDSELNIVFSLQLVKILRKIAEDKKELANYSNLKLDIDVSRLNMSESERRSASFSYTRMGLSRLGEKAEDMKNSNFLIQIDNLTGSDVIILSNKATQVCEHGKSLILKQASLSESRRESSLISEESAVELHMKLNNLKFLYFQLPSLKKTISVDMMKQHQQIEISAPQFMRRVFLVASIQLDSFGRKQVTLRSPVELRNRMEMPIEVSLTQLDQARQKVILLQPGSSEYLPLEYLDYNEVQMRPIKLKEGNYTDIYQPFLLSDRVILDDSISEGKILSAVNKDTAETFYSVLYTEETGKSEVLLFDYTVQLINTLPFDWFVFFSSSSVAAAEIRKRQREIVMVNSYSALEGNFSYFDHIKKVQLLDGRLLPKNVIDLSLMFDKKEGSFLFRDKSDEEVLVKYNVVIERGKLKMCLFVDFLVVSEVREELCLKIDNNDYQNTYFLIENEDEEEPEMHQRKATYESLASFKESRIERTEEVETTEHSTRLISLHSKGFDTLAFKVHKRLKLQANMADLKTSFIEESKLKSEITQPHKTVNFTDNPRFAELIADSKIKLVSYIPKQDQKIMIKTENSAEFVECKHLTDLIYSSSILKLPTLSKGLAEISLSTLDITEEILNYSVPTLTRLVTITNRFKFINKTDAPFILTQEDSFNSGFFILHKELDFHWTSEASPRKIKLKSHTSAFSRAFSITNIGEYFISLRENRINRVLKVTVIEADSKFTVIIEDTTSEPPILLGNSSNFCFRVSEKEFSDNSVLVRPHCQSSFCVDRANSKIEVAMATSIEYLDCPESYRIVTQLDLNSFSSVESSDKERKFEFEGGMLKVLRNEDGSFAIRFYPVERSENINRLYELSEAEDSSTSVEIVFSARSIGVSVIDLMPKELLYFSVNSFSLESRISSDMLALKLSSDSLQVDNCLSNAVFISPLVIPSGNRSVRVEANVIRNKLGNMLFVDDFYFAVNSRIKTKIDGNFMAELINFYKNIQNIMESGENEDKSNLKIIVNKANIQPISLSLHLKPNTRLIKGLSSSQKMLVLLSKLEDLNFAFSGFNFKGSQSLETVSKMMISQFVQDNNNLIFKYIFSLNILFSINHTFKGIQYGLNSFTEQISYTKEKRLIDYPVGLVKGLFEFNRLVALGLVESVVKFGGSVSGLINRILNLNEGKVKVIRLPEVQIGTYLALTEGTKAVLSSLNANISQTKVNLSLFSYDRRAVERNILLENVLKKRGMLSWLFSKQTWLFPLILALTALKQVESGVRSVLPGSEENKVRPTRYINASSMKIERYNRERSQAYVYS